MYSCQFLWSQLQCEDEIYCLQILFCSMVRPVGLFVGAFFVCLVGFFKRIYEDLNLVCLAEVGSKPELACVC